MIKQPNELGFFLCSSAGIISNSPRPLIMGRLKPGDFSNILFRNRDEPPASQITDSHFVSAVISEAVQSLNRHSRTYHTWTVFVIAIGAITLPTILGLKSLFFIGFTSHSEDLGQSNFLQHDLPSVFQFESSRNHSSMSSQKIGPHIFDVLELLSSDGLTFFQVVQKNVGEIWRGDHDSTTMDLKCTDRLFVQPTQCGLHAFFS